MQKQVFFVRMVVMPMRMSMRVPVVMMPMRMSVRVPVVMMSMRMNVPVMHPTMVKSKNSNCNLSTHTNIDQQTQNSNKQEFF